MSRRAVHTFEDRPFPHILESETVDWDNRSFSFTLFAHDDPDLITLILGKEQRTASRAAMKEGLQRILDGIDTVEHSKGAAA